MCQLVAQEKLPSWMLKEKARALMKVSFVFSIWLDLRVVARRSSGGCSATSGVTPQVPRNDEAWTGLDMKRNSFTAVATCCSMVWVLNEMCCQFVQCCINPVLECDPLIHWRICMICAWNELEDQHRPSKYAKTFWCHCQRTILPNQSRWRPKLPQGARAVWEMRQILVLALRGN